MKFPALITGVEHRSGVSKKNNQPYDMVTVTAVDISKEGKCATPLEFTLAKEDMDLADKLDGEKVMLEIRKLGVYQGRLDPQIRVSREQAKPAVTSTPANQAPK